MDIIKDDSNLLELIKFLQKEIINRKWAEKKASDALDYAESIIDSVQTPLIVLDDEYKIISANMPFYQLFGLTIDQSIGQKFFETGNRLFDIQEIKDIVFSDKEESLPIQIYQEFKILGKKFLEIKSVNLQYNIKHLRFKLVIINDITTFINTQKALEKTILEKQSLYFEIQHRIKNNLYSIESLLNMELGNIQDEKAREAFSVSISRIHNIGTIYESLYRSKDLKSISINDYFNDFVISMRTLFINNIEIIYEPNSNDFKLDGNIFFPLGLILNELVTNAMKHAFTGVNNGFIKLSAHNKENIITVIVQDNGIGYSDKLINNHFGYELIVGLAAQIGGKINFHSENGTKCTLEFPAEIIQK